MSRTQRTRAVRVRVRGAHQGGGALRADLLGVITR